MTRKPQARRRARSPLGASSRATGTASAPHAEPTVPWGCELASAASSSPWRRRPQRATITWIRMQTPHEVLLCDDIDANQLWAVLDELTLTYSVVFRTRSGSSRALRRHVASLREARAWAGGYQDSQLA